MVSPDALWGGRLTGVRFDPIEHLCGLAVETTVSGHRSSFLVTCRGVSELRFHNTIPEPWSYAEITEVHLSVDETSGQQLLEVVLWSEDAGLTVRCRSVAIDNLNR